MVNIKLLNLKISSTQINRIMKQTFSLFYLLLLTGLIFAQNTVHLSIVEEGRGILRSRGSECFIVAPYHLIQNAETKTITITGENQKTSTGKFIKSYPGDIAIIRIEKGANQDCTEWKISKSFTTLLKNSYEGFLEIRNDDGSFDHEPMYFKKQTDQGITIQAKDPSFEFAKGMSGSSLFSNINGVKTYLGMLLSVDESNSKLGNVFQADDMDRIINDFFLNNIVSEYGQTLSYNNFTFKIKDILTDGNQIKIILDANTSLSKETLIFYGSQYGDNSTMLFDCENKTSKINLFKMGDKVYHGAYGGWTSTELFSGSSQSIELTFNNVSKIKFPINLQLSFGDSQIIFRNLNSLSNLSENANSIVSNSPLKSIEFDDFKLEIMENTQQDETVILRGKITALENDSHLILSGNNYGDGSTMIYSSRGDKIKVTKIKIADQTIEGNCYVAKKLIKNIPTQIQFYFDNVLTDFDFVNLQLAVGGNGGKPILVRKIPIKK